MTKWLNQAFTDTVCQLHLHAAELFRAAQEIVIVEGLVLDEVSSGVLQLTCLPLKLGGSDGAPARCVAQL